jgi:RNA polymerase sigma factor (sigma-70 family)
MIANRPFLDISPSPPPRGAYAMPIRRKQMKGGVRVVEDASDWAALMISVRVHKDKVAFAALFAHFAPRVKGFLMKSGTDAATAEDCAQDVMATLWNKAHLFDPARASVATWVFTIARNRRIDIARKARRPEPEDVSWGPDEEPDNADVYAAAQEAERLRAALSELPENQRLLIQRAYFGELSQSKLAEETGLPLGTIKSRIRLALERLRKQMV